MLPKSLKCPPYSFLIVNFFIFLKKCDLLENLVLAISNERPVNNAIALSS